MSLAKRNTRRSTHAETLGKLLNNFPGVEKVFEHVHINRPGDIEYPIKTTTPVLYDAAKEHTMVAYELYVIGYNKKVRTERSKAKKYNAFIENEIKKKPEANWSKNQKHFKASYSNLNVWEYNKKVSEHNQQFGNIIPMRMPQTLKQNTKEFFRVLLFLYSYQLHNRKETRKKTGLVWQSAVPKIEVNTKHIENARGKYGLYLTDMCPDTMLNHKNRMIEAGILINNQNRSSKRGTLHHISPEILVVFDDFDQKLICTDNQLLKISKPEVFRDIVPPTRAINQSIIKRDVHNFTPLDDKDKSAKTDLHNELSPTSKDSTRAPSGKMQNPGLNATAAKNLKTTKSKVPADNHKNTGTGDTKTAENSAFLAEKIENPADFCKKLSKNEYENENPIPIERLQHEANNGILPQSEFRDVLIQDLFKQFSKMYTNHTNFDVVFIGVWVWTLTSWSEGDMMMNKNGQHLQKTTQLLRYKEIIYSVLNKKWGALPHIQKGKFIPPNPKKYLNPKNSSPGTFGYHFHFVKEKSQIVELAKKTIAQQSKKQSKQSWKYTNNLKKLNRNITKMFNGKISDQELFIYVRDNMPKEIQMDFHKHIENYKHNKTKTN